eukprot:767393-Hanusia_phi.AAC.2
MLGQKLPSSGKLDVGAGAGAGTDSGTDQGRSAVAGGGGGGGGEEEEENEEEEGIVYFIAHRLSGACCLSEKFWGQGRVRRKARGGVGGAEANLADLEGMEGVD